MNDALIINDDNYQQAIASVRRTLEKLSRCSNEEKEKLQQDLTHLNDMLAKLTGGRVEIVVFGEISTGKSALINALVGEAVRDVDVRGGWTKEVWGVAWNGCGYRVPGAADSEVVLIDTPGLNEVGGQLRTEMAREAARRADLILFVTDSDLNETEFAALTELAALHKPIVLVLNKIDLYSREQRQRLLEVLRDERLQDIVPAEQIVPAAADPREVEYVVESSGGRSRNEWRKPAADVGELKATILEVLETEGLALLALNAAMYAADKSDRIASLRVQLRGKRANQTIWSYAAIKAVAVALNPFPVADVLGGGAVDVTMVVTLAHIYGLEMSWQHARSLVTSIGKAAGWMVGGWLAGEAVVHITAAVLKTATLGHSILLTAIPQGTAAGYGSYIVGQAAKYYFEHGASWGGQSPKAIVRRILQQTDKKSVLRNLKAEIKKAMLTNPHATKTP